MSGLFKELKRRNVFKVGTAYVVLAWLLAQVTDVFLEPFGVPDWVIKTILLVLLGGFPLALFFAWAFELTPEGIMKEVELLDSHMETSGDMAAAWGFFRLMVEPAGGGEPAEMRGRIMDVAKTSTATGCTSPITPRYRWQPGNREPGR